MSRIPKKAKRVFKGEIFEIWQWDQKMFDGSTEVFEMAKRPDAVQIIATQGEKILVAHQSQPDRDLYLSLFGGRADEGENHLTAAKRELLEELGMESSDWELWKTYVPERKIDWNVYFYIARNCRITGLQKLDPGEKIETKWLSFEEFISAFSREPYGQFTADLLRMQLDPKLLNEFRRKLFS